MENEDSAITFGLILCLVVAILGLLVGAGSPSDHHVTPNSSDRPMQTGQMMVLD